MTYVESSALMSDIDFRNRIKVACLKFADYISGEPPSTPGHNSRIRWASSCFTGPDMTASQVQPPTVMEPPVQAEGAAISDADLQTAVETTVKKML
jgi:hypothetical protein